jgi:phosphohistidine phosphatase
VTRTIYLLRHAKSSWDDPGLPDHERPLAPRGRRAGKQMAEHLRETGVAPELVLCSSAVRTRQTLDLIRAALGDTAVEVEDGLYGAGSDDLLDRLRSLPDSTSSVLLLGHNPGLEQLALLLAGSGDELDRLQAKFPTGALATIAVPPAPWSSLNEGDGELTAFVVPKQLR